MTVVAGKNFQKFYKIIKIVRVFSSKHLNGIRIDKNKN